MMMAKQEVVIVVMEKSGMMKNVAVMQVAMMTIRNESVERVRAVTETLRRCMAKSCRGRVTETCRGRNMRHRRQRPSWSNVPRTCAANMTAARMSNISCVAKSRLRRAMA